MAKKSSDSTKDAATTKKASPKAGVKKTAVKKTAAPKAETASKSGTPKATATTKKSATTATPKAPKAAATTKKAAPKKAAGPKLNDRQVEFLKKIKDAGDAGYAVGQKVEERTLEALGTRKLVKRGAKNKETGKHHYSLTKLGEKSLGTATAGSSDKAAPGA